MTWMLLNSIRQLISSRICCFVPSELKWLMTKKVDILLHIKNLWPLLRKVYGLIVWVL